MNNLKSTKINGEMLLNIGYPHGIVIGVAIKTVDLFFQEMDENQLITILKKVLEYPESFIADEQLGEIAKALSTINVSENDGCIELKPEATSFEVFGAEHIEEGAFNQMKIAMRLPVTAAGALMPDAHQGYGLPIGGVLATRNAIIPYGVGVDIGCRMALSVYDVPEAHFLANESSYKRELIAFTKFGAGQEWKSNMRAEHLVLDKNEFNLNPLIKSLKDKAYAQLGTSGGGNHFVEFGIIEFENDDAILNIKKGKYLALLTHSGSRGFGATIAGHYTRLAKDLCKLPQEAANLAYLDLNSSEGQEYWIAMNLAGDYASACHDVIHQRMAKAIGAEVLAKVENHHNFAWKEMWNGEEVIVHRKGATPAAEGVMGIIPGSMTAPGFLVRGKGNANALQSASHGAGRQLSRTQAIKNITKNDMQKILKDHGVSLIGAGRDEAPMAYKDIHTVMAAQKELVDVVACFTPKIVRMADDGSRED